MKHVLNRWARVVLGPALAVLIVGLTPGVSGAAEAGGGHPKLILQITVDALRADLPERYASVLGEDGFKRLWSNGITYSNANYRHANTETVVGHASLATGTVPARHGMIGNVWFDRELGRLVYNIEDARYRLLTAGADVDEQTEIDPTQKAAKVDGRSPTAILTSTFSDELAIYFNGRSKIFGVSVKDRGAVTLAGQTGKAFWFSKATGEFVTSTYYYDEYPQWVTDWNAGKPVGKYAGKAWDLLLEPDAYQFAGADDQGFETDFPGFGRAFPHALGAADDKYMTTRLTLSPAGDELTLDFAKALLTEEQLGQDDVPDFLAVSFSSTDYVGHIFGASSLEAEDNMARLDRTLADLLGFVDKHVGLENTLIVLSADHGQPEVPGHLNQLGVSTASYFDVEALDKTPAIEALKTKFGIGEELIEAFFQPYLYLNNDIIEKEGLDKVAVEQTLAETLMQFEGISVAIPSSALRSGAFPNVPVIDAVLNNFHPKRSGDIYVVFNPNVFINDFDGLEVASVHGSPWRYDTHVPVIFSGYGLKARTVTRPVAPYDIAPTLSAVIGAKAPSGAVGQPLQEVLEN
ncbi:alkaline phosphatase family protein [Marinobacter sp. M216]|uniref:Alkaline phosphatase family protein n=1 Tax=Marinobacter albus TaxID=3030833 RepID=A0ABT7HHU1_9GAMM|nr:MULTISPECIES: alkaline phosphatase family protein [unclassified Marinobacter]MBW7472525.1 alkaline phosphatase family protein [Marinobacter sp. F4218]MDK9559075.1 alkaline phosphatase family protein [Marinobacter sp. M216]